VGLAAVAAMVAALAVSRPANLAIASPSGAAAGSGPLQWTVYHFDAAGTGVANSAGSVSTAAPKWTSPALDGQLFGEPLVFAGRVYVATENDTVYALSVATGAVQWSVHLATPVPAGALPCGDVSPSVGITGTPVIDPKRAEIFVVADEYDGASPVHELVGLSTTTGHLEMKQDVDPVGADAAALLQRTGLALDAGKVVFGFGGNYGDCGSYHGWVVSTSESGGQPTFFEVDSAAGERQGAIWMGGGAPAIDAKGDIWVEAGNGSVTSSSGSYDDSDSVLELSSRLKLLQFFAPVTWALDNGSDLDLSTEPALLGNGEVLAAGKSRTAFLLAGRHLGGIGGQQAELGGVCGDDVDGGMAVVGATVYLPCLSGTVAIKVSVSPPGLRLLWSSGTGGGPPIVAGGRVWTIGQDGVLYGLDPSSGAVRQRASIGAPANHFPTPSVGDGVLLAPASDRVVAFTAAGSSTTTSSTAAPGTTTRPATTATTAASRPSSSTTGPGTGRASRHSSLPTAIVAVIVIAGVAAGAGIALLARRRRR